jgi:polyisoprenoid-binding protein YceI
MKKIKYIILPLSLLAIIFITTGYSELTSPKHNNKAITVVENKQNQTINLFVTHGHCSTPFAGNVENLVVEVPTRPDLGNPLGNMQISFEINPNTFNVCAGDDLTKRIKTPGLFIAKNNKNITFRSTDIYTMGLDWYQVNGKMSIKGVEKDVKLFVTGIRDKDEERTSSLVIEAQMNLFDWGIDYDLIVNGKSDSISTKWMHFNMKIKLVGV